MPNQNQNPGNFANNPARAAAAGRLGGQRSSGNFANNPERAAAAGRLGGQKSSGNFANNPERAAAAGRVGGQNSHGSRNQQDSLQTTNRNRSASDTDSGFSTPAGRSGNQNGGFTTPSRGNDRDEY